MAREGHPQHAAYVERLLRDLDTWCDRGGMAGRPVTTVHFGGGTPDQLGHERLAKLVTDIGARLNVSDTTEWAMEAMRADLLLPTVNYIPGPGMEIDCALHEAEKLEQEYVLKNSFGFGGCNSCMVFKKTA